MSAKKKLFFVYLIFIHIALAVILLNIYFIPQLQTRLGFEKSSSEFTPHFKKMLTFHKWMDGNVPQGAVIFIGDSITQGLAVAAVSPKSVNFGIGADTTTGVLERLSEYKSLSRAKAIVISIGVNDLTRRDNGKITNNYKLILDKFPNNIPIIVSAILPVGETIKKKTRQNNRIRTLNIAIKSLCEKYTNVNFVNPTKQLVDSKHNLSDLYHVGDGVHLNTRGYEIWIGELRKALKNV